MRLTDSSLKKDDCPTLEKFETLNVLSEITGQYDHTMPAQLKQALESFIETCMDYRVDESGGKHFISAIADSNDYATEAKVSMSALTGLRPHVVNTFIRRALIEHYTQLAKEQERQ
ncbi:TPA: hypothetical protein NKQ52_005064 [Vibrio parahaemolyticus]|nr:hypothetical protein [Vibrio parahaemolyticus]HCH1657824.1 hypothetical protein [Vibrio parahaemolyticus]HCH1661191.1 hypothetical protein [Vibrio parahaemolyticus]